jgi:peptidoglycan/LPS O-acetylase OafA/YrhL
LSAATYRADVDGLRAVAILSVVLYHCGIGFVSGGFVGVDVFFVISGFLISRIVVGEIADGRFSIVTFYKRRILRIIPALTVVVAATLAVGAIVFPPASFKALAASAMAAVAFYSNFFFKNSFDYFAADSSTQPLLHTWSLGVEDQFYLLAPWLLILAARFRKAMPWAFAALFALSLGFSVYFTSSDRSFAFYLLPARAFELMTGIALSLGLLPSIRSRRATEIVGIAGLGLIAASVVLFDDGTSFPGFIALVPCVGALLVIWSGTGSVVPLAGRMLALRPVVFVGKVSYSFYLWHWPALAYGAYITGSPLPPPLALALAVGAFLASVTSYHLVEQPFRKRGAAAPAWRAYVGGLAVILAVLAADQIIKRTKGLPERLPPEAAHLAAIAPTRLDLSKVCREAVASDDDAGRDCAIGAGTGDPVFLLWGDSHAAAIAPRVAELARQAGLSGHATFRGGCPPLLGLDKLTTSTTFRKCVRQFAEIGEILDKPTLRTVVIAARWVPYLTGHQTDSESGNEPRLFVKGDFDASRAVFERMLTDTLAELGRRGLKVVIIAAVPEAGYDVPTDMIRGLMRGVPSTRSIDRAYYDERQKDMSALFDRFAAEGLASVVYPHQSLCDDTRCRTEADGLPLYIDDDHLSPKGTEVIEPVLRQALGLD